MARHYLSAVAQNDKNLSPQQAQQTLFELRVRQIELEMEQQELRAASAQLRMNEQIIRTLAYNDALTGLANRLLLRVRLTQAMLAGSRSGCHGALLFLDMDHFKAVNDQYGHGAGDQLLIEVAARLSRCVGASDTVARLGGDEFVVLLDELAPDMAQAGEHAAVLAEAIRTALAQPYSLRTATDGPTVRVQHACSVSIGVVLFLGQARSEERLLSQADAVMYQAKAAGRNQVRFHASARGLPA